MHALVTGGAGFIGSHLCERLVKKRWKVTILDNLSTGSKDNIQSQLTEQPDKVRFIEGDCANPRVVKKALEGVETVFHFAANPEIRLERCEPKECFKQNLYATHVLLEELKEEPHIHEIIFASTSSVYGDAERKPTKEDYAPLKPISVYGASKLAGEALVSAYAYTYNKEATILRLANIIGPRSGHGVIHDFMEKLVENPRHLEILGDGTQIKSYLYIADCVEAVMATWEINKKQVEIYNVASENQTPVRRIAEIVVEEIGLRKVKFHCTGGVDGGRGWKGDVKDVLLDISKLQGLGWRPRLNSEEAVRKATRRIIAAHAKQPRKSR
jgi:UDP-glucose 4-epimerase